MLYNSKTLILSSKSSLTSPAESLAKNLFIILFFHVSYLLLPGNQSQWETKQADLGKTKQNKTNYLDIWITRDDGILVTACCIPTLSFSTLKSQTPIKAHRWESKEKNQSTKFGKPEGNVTGAFAENFTVLMKIVSGFSSKEGGFHAEASLTGGRWLANCLYNLIT